MVVVVQLLQAAGAFAAGLLLLLLLTLLVVRLPWQSLLLPLNSSWWRCYPRVCRGCCWLRYSCASSRGCLCCHCSTAAGAARCALVVNLRLAQHAPGVQGWSVATA